MNLHHRFLQYCVRQVPAFIVLSSLERGELCIRSHQAHLQPLVYFLRNHSHCRFHQLTDITAVDYPQKHLRFEVVYHLLSLAFNRRLRLKVSVQETMALPSLQQLYLNSSWLEREVWDMFGVFFHHHSRLRRILTDYGFVGYPLRKDFPCSGYREVRYSEQLQKVVYEPLELSSNLRFGS